MMKNKYILLLFFALSVSTIHAQNSENSDDEAARTWSDKTGKFKVKAKLLSNAEGKIKLLKEDGLVITVPIDRLSEADQKFLNEKDNPFSGGEPLKNDMTEMDRKTEKGETAASASLSKDANVLELPSDGKELFVDSVDEAGILPADPLPYELKPVEFVRSLEKTDAYCRTSFPMLANPKEPSFLVSIHRVGNAASEESFGKIFLVNKAETQPNAVLDIDQSIALLDHHIESGRTLAALGVDSPSSRGGDLVLFDKMVSGAPKLIARWHCPGWDKRGFKPKYEFARLLSESKALVRVDNMIYLWDLVQGKLIFKIKPKYSGGKIQVSCNGRYLVIPDRKTCMFIGLQEGKVLGTIPSNGKLVPEIHFSPDGKQIAMVAGNEFSVWDFTKSASRASVNLGHPNGKFVGWMGNNRLLTQLNGLIDVDLRISLWGYSLPSNNQSLTMSTHVATIQRSTRLTTLICIPIPHAPAKTAIEKLVANNSGFLVVTPDSNVALEINAPNSIDKPEIRKKLEEAIDETGWTLKPSADVIVKIDIEQGERQKMFFRSSGFMFGAAEEVTMRPFKVQTQIQKNGKTIWERPRENMIPGVIFLKRGQKLREVLKTYEKGNPSYFDRFNLPPRIVRPDIADKLGKSYISDNVWKELTR